MPIKVITTLPVLPNGYGNIIYANNKGERFIDPLSPRSLLAFLGQFQNVRIQVGGHGEDDVIYILEAECPTPE